MAGAAKQLPRSPHVLAERAQLTDELRRKGLGVAGTEPTAEEDADVMAWLTPAERLAMQRAALALVMAENRRDAGLPPPGLTVGDDWEPAEAELVRQVFATE